MSWRAESTFQASSKLSDDEKEYLKVAKKIREIMKLEERAREGEQLEAKQLEKVANMESLMKDIGTLAVRLPERTEVLDKNQDITDMLPNSVQDKILKQRRSNVERKERKEEDQRKDREKPVFMSRHDRPLSGVTVSSDGKFLFTCSKDKFVICWSMAESLLKAVCTLSGHIGAVWGVDVSRTTGEAGKQPSRLLTGGADGKVMLWPVDPITRARQEVRNNPDAVLEHGGIVRVLRWCPFDGENESQRFASACEKLGKKDISITVWSVTGKKIQQVLEIKDLPTKANDIQWGGGAKTKLFSAHDNGYVGIWSVDGSTGSLLKTLKLHSGLVASLTLTSDGTTLVTASHDKTACAVDITQRDTPTLATYKTNRPLNAVAVSPDYKPGGTGFITVAGGRDPREVTTSKLLEDEFEAKVFQSETGETVASGKGHFGPVHALLSLRVGKAGTQAFATASEDGTLKIHGADGKLLHADTQ